MGQFSVEICHLVGQFSMKLNTEAGEGGFCDTGRARRDDLSDRYDISRGPRNDA